MMLVYKVMSPNIALGTCGGGAFRLSLLALAWVSKSEVSLLQRAGHVAIVAGLILWAAGKSVTLWPKIFSTRDET